MLEKFRGAKQPKTAQNNVRIIENVVIFYINITPHPPATLCNGLQVGGAVCLVLHLGKKDDALCFDTLFRLKTNPNRSTLQAEMFNHHSVHHRYFINMLALKCCFADFWTSGGKSIAHFDHVTC